MKKKQYKTLCVILHYGSEKYTNECIASINGVKNLDIVIVDNDSNQSYKPLKKFRKFVKIIKSGGLLGFASANNLGVKKSLKKYHNSILIINNDTVVTKGSIEYLKETLAIKNVGMAGPCMPYVKNIRKIWACGGFINKIRLCWPYAESKTLPSLKLIALIISVLSFKSCRNFLPPIAVGK